MSEQAHDDEHAYPTMSVRAAATLLGVSISTIYLEALRYRSSGGADGLPNIKFGSRILVMREPVLKLVALA